MKSVLFFIICFIIVNGQSMTGSYMKYDYCVKGSPTCTGNGCGGVAGLCIADAYILLDTCTMSGLGVNQPPFNPNVFSQYLCDGTQNYQVNYTTLAACQADTTYPNTDVFTTMNSLGYSNFCYGKTVGQNNNPFAQINMATGYYTQNTISCPSGNVTGITFIADPLPTQCVASPQKCTSSSPPFIVSQLCYPPITCTPACAANGACTATNVCTCSNGYTGKQCQTAPVCYTISSTNAKVCSGHGTCPSANKCVCNQGFYGEKCATAYKCYTLASNNAKVCSGHGACVGTNKCQCSTGFTGTKCETSSTAVDEEEVDEEL